MSCCFPEKRSKKAPKNQEEPKSEPLQETKTEKSEDTKEKPSSKPAESPRKTTEESASSKSAKSNKSIENSVTTPRSTQRKEVSEVSKSESGRGRGRGRRRKKKKIKTPRTLSSLRDDDANEGTKSAEPTPRGRHQQAVSNDADPEPGKASVESAVLLVDSSKSEEKTARVAAEPDSAKENPELKPDPPAVPNTAEAASPRSDGRTTKSAPATPAGAGEVRTAGKRKVPHLKSMAIPMNYPQLALPDVIVPPTASGVSWTPRSPIRTPSGSRSSSRSVSVTRDGRSASIAASPRNMLSPRTIDTGRSRGVSMSPRYTQSMPADNAVSVSGSGARAAADPRAAMRRMMERNKSETSEVTGGKSKLSRATRQTLRERSASVVAQLVELEAEREAVKQKAETEEITLDDLDDGHIGATLAEFEELSSILPTPDIDADLAATTVVLDEKEKNSALDKLDKALESSEMSAKVIADGAKAIEDLVAMAADIDIDGLDD